MTAHLPFGNWNLLLCLGSHRVQLPSKEGAHFLCHRHVLGLKLLHVLDQLQDAGCLRGPQRSQKGAPKDQPRRLLSPYRAQHTQTPSCS